MGQVAPGVAVLGQVEEGVDDLAPLVPRGASALLGDGDQRREFVPLIIGQVGRVGAAGLGECSIPSVSEDGKPFHTISKHGFSTIFA